MKSTSRRTVLLKGGDMKRTSRRTVLLKGGDMTLLSDWLKVLPRGCGTTER